jgi:hypothetical protein
MHRAYQQPPIGTRSARTQDMEFLVPIVVVGVFLADALLRGQKGGRGG